MNFKLFFCLQLTIAFFVFVTFLIHAKTQSEDRCFNKNEVLTNVKGDQYVFCENDFDQRSITSSKTEERKSIVSKLKEEN